MYKYILGERTCINIKKKKGSLSLSLSTSERGEKTSKQSVTKQANVHLFPVMELYLVELEREKPFPSGPLQ